ncbi:MAG: lysine--tRNA ligase [Patescibacteria group bacterium]
MAEIAHASEEKTRLAKIKTLQQAGIALFPSWNEDRTPVEDVLRRFALLKPDQRVTVAGRLMSIRVQGGTSFAHVHDQSGRIQLFFKKDIVGEEPYQLFVRYLDRGDIIAATGTPFITKRGEQSLLVASFSILAKAILPLPEKRAGLQDAETRLRKRYVDMLTDDAVRERLIMKSRLIATIRQFLIDRGYLEVETPVLQPLYGGTLARPFETHHNTLNLKLYLRISPELYLKRLVVGGLEKVFEIGKMFRNEGADRDHNPEFTILETMAAYHSYHYNMELVQECYEYCAQTLLGTTDIPYGEKVIRVGRPWIKMSMTEAIEKHTGINVREWTSLKDATQALTRAGVDKKKIKQAHSVGLAIALLFEEKVEEHLSQPTIIYNHPVETSPLAKRCADDPAFVERFEHFIGGSEHGNHYSELNDPLELKQRFLEEQRKAKKGSAVENVHQPDYDFLEAVKYGLPPTSGLSIGIDRMAMLFTNAETIRDVISFPVLRPKRS